LCWTFSLLEVGLCHTVHCSITACFGLSFKSATAPPLPAYLQCSTTAPPLPAYLQCSTTAPPLLHHCSTTAPPLLHHCSTTFGRLNGPRTRSLKRQLETISNWAGTPYSAGQGKRISTNKSQIKNVTFSDKLQDGIL
jgi:hypothetical protein